VCLSIFFLLGRVGLPLAYRKQSLLSHLLPRCDFSVCFRATVFLAHVINSSNPPSLRPTVLPSPSARLQSLLPTTTNVQSILVSALPIIPFNLRLFSPLVPSLLCQVYCTACLKRICLPGHFRDNQNRRQACVLAGPSTSDLGREWFFVREQGQPRGQPRQPLHLSLRLLLVHLSNSNNSTYPSPPVYIPQATRQNPALALHF